MPCPYGCAVCWGWESRLGAAGGHGMVVSALCAAGTSSIAFKRAFPPLVGSPAGAAVGRGRRSEPQQQAHAFKTESERGQRLRGCLQLLVQCGLS